MIVGKNRRITLLVTSLYGLRLITHEEHDAKTLPFDVRVEKDGTTLLEVNTCESKLKEI